MGIVLTFLLAGIAFWALVIGLIYPKAFNWLFKGKADRKKVSIVFCSAFVIFVVALILFGTGQPVIAKVKTPTNQKNTTISGSSAYKNSKIKVIRNNETIKEAEADGGGKFNVEIELAEGSNKIQVSSTNAKGTTKKSSQVDIILDTVIPELSIEQPQSPTSTDKFGLKGKSEKNVQVIIYSGDKEIKKIKTDSDSFEVKDISLIEGENKFAVKAVDEADNYSLAKDITIAYNKPSTTETAKTEPPKEETKTEVAAFEFIKSKTEADENKNKMDLYTYNGEFNLDKLKTICKEKKEEFGNGNTGLFYYLVVFNNKDNAVFPQDPFTASYGIEEVPQKHIKAMYEYNRKNGYSKLDYYDSNKWEGVAKTEDL